MNTIDSIRDTLLKKQEQIRQIQKESENLEKTLKKLVEEEEKLRLDSPVSLRELLEVKNQNYNFSVYSHQGLPMTHYPTKLTDAEIQTLNDQLEDKWNRESIPVDTAIRIKKNMSDNPESSPQQ